MSGKTDQPTPRTTLAAGLRLRVWCKMCQHQADADLAVLIARGRGDLPLRELVFPCRRTEFVVMGPERPARD